MENSNEVSLSSAAPNGDINSSASQSQTSEASQTAQDYIAAQLALEADAREVLPYQFDSCTKPLGALRQSVFACLTCTPPPASPHQQFTPAGICYSCSISCHGEHNLVELFSKRNFVCDCGTTRLSNSGTPCSLRHNTVTSRKGGVVGEDAREGNKYNHNFQGRFCGCGDEYDPEKEKGTMFQCLGLGTVEDGGCGEDWWHPECLLGLPRTKTAQVPKKPQTNHSLETVPEEEGEEREDDLPLPDGFPAEDDFDHLICYKCVEAFPWIKRYAGSAGFLHTPHVPKDAAALSSDSNNGSKKRKAEDRPEGASDAKKAKAVTNDTPVASAEAHKGINGKSEQPVHATLPPPPNGPVTLFLAEDFRSRFCRCRECFPLLAKHPQLLEEETSYEPPLSESSDAGGEGSVAGRSINSGSLLERGEAALSSMDRVRAIEGVMAYNHVRDKVKAFLQPFAESGRIVGAEDIKEYFAKLRGDEQTVRETGAAGFDGNNKTEQEGY